MLRTNNSNFAIFLLWVFLVSIGALVGCSLPGFLLIDFSDRDLDLMIFWTLLFAGLFIGLGQWIVINLRLKKTWYWIPATSIGYSFGGFVFFIFDFVGTRLLHLDMHYFSEYATLMATGMFTGVLQWLALKRKTATSLRWSLISGLSLLLGGIAIDFMININTYLADYFYILVFGLAIGLFSGVFIKPLILHPES